MKQDKRFIMQSIGKVFLTWKRHVQSHIHPYGLTINQYEVLRQMMLQGALNPSDIAEMLFSERSTATVVIKNMEKKGWLKREIDPEDHRRFRVSLTRAGMAKYQELPWSDPEFRKTMFKPAACFSSQEKMMLKELLAKLDSHLDSIR